VTAQPGTDLPAVLAAYLEAHDSATSAPVELHQWALSADPLTLADYTYDAGSTFGSELATAALGWLRECGQPPVQHLLEDADEHAQLELVVDDDVLRAWLLAHRPQLLLAVCVAQATASSRWIYDHDLREQLAVRTPDQARDLIAVLSSMTAVIENVEAPEQLFAAVLGATRGAPTP
jgi:hypothetical protein